MFNLPCTEHLLHEYFITKTMKTQGNTITKNWLYSHGYTIAGAARIIGRSAAHVNMVLNGKRESLAVIRELSKLPVRPLRLREKLTH